MTILLIWLICSKVLTFKLGQSNLRFHCPLKSTHLRYFWGHQWCSTTYQFSSVWHVVGLRAFLSEMRTWASLWAGECEWQKHLPFPHRSLQKPGCNLPLPLPQWSDGCVKRRALAVGQSPHRPEVDTKPRKESNHCCFKPQRYLGWFIFSSTWFKYQLSKLWVKKRKINKESI